MAESGVLKDICSYDLRECEEFFAGLGEPSYRAGQFIRAYAAGLRLDEITNFSKQLRAKIAENAEYRLPEIIRKQVSSYDGTAKYLMEMTDGETAECVLMRYGYGNTLCVSSQVGCRMGCRFCASTIGGKVRDLLPSEIYGQVTAAQRDCGERIDGIVMMGMGEPLDNYDNVIKFLRLVNMPGGLNIGYRHISLSTCGLADRIYRLAKENLPITLSISLHAPDNASRSAIMPVNDAYPVEKLMRACRDYYDACGRRLSFEYTLIHGKNDSEKDASALASVLREYFPKGMPVHVNLIRLNKVEERNFTAPAKEDTEKFRNVLEKAGISATVRRRLGPDIDAACGQLRRKDNLSRKNG